MAQDEDSTDVMVVSDHGFSTIAHGSDMVGALKNAKINAFSKMENPEKGDVFAAVPFVQSLQKWKGELANGAGNLEEGDEN